MIAVSISQGQNHLVQLFPQLHVPSSMPELPLCQYSYLCGHQSTDPSLKNLRIYLCILIQTKPFLWLLCYCINCCVSTKQEVAQEQPWFKHCCHVLRMLSVTVWFAVTSGPPKGPNVGDNSAISLSLLSCTSCCTGRVRPYTGTVQRMKSAEN